MSWPEAIVVVAAIAGFAFILGCLLGAININIDWRRRP